MNSTWKTILIGVAIAVGGGFITWSASQLWTRNQQVTEIVQQVTASQKDVTKVLKEISVVQSNLNTTTKQLTDLVITTKDLQYRLRKAEKHNAYLVIQVNNLAEVQKQTMRDWVKYESHGITYDEINKLFKPFNDAKASYKRDLTKLEDTYYEKVL